MGVLYLLFSFLLTFIAMPAVIKLASWKQLFDPPDGRKLHKRHISALGGVALFGTVMVSAVTFLDATQFSSFRYLFASYLLIFLLGVLDDLRQASYWLKLIVQVSAALVVVIPGELYFSSFQGLFAVFEISRVLGSVFAVAFIILVINAFNFIDGLDGLAALLGILILLPAALWFYYDGQEGWMAITLFMAGSLAGFMAYNRPPAMIFMGDSGSLSTGFLIAVAAIAFIERNIVISMPHHFLSSPAVAFSLLSVPLFDILRLTVIRLARGKSPFSPDLGHIHHHMLRKGIGNLGVLLILGGYTTLLFGINLLLDSLGLGVNYLMSLNFLLTAAFFAILLRGHRASV